MLRSDQTRYHQEWVGFSKEIGLNANSGAITTFDPTDSLAFQTRYQDWRGFRVIGWTCSIIPLKGYDQASGMTAHAAYNQSLFGPTPLSAPINIESLLELPNCKTTSISDSNPRSKINFQWFNRRGDINSLPFQSLSVLQSVEYNTGLISFAKTSSAISYQVCGKLLVQFKDKNFLNAIPPAPPGSSVDDIQCEYPESPTGPVVKRLGRNLILNN
jgi:hypothetical protein